MRKSTLWFIAAMGLLWTMTAFATIVKSPEMPDNKMEVATPPVSFYETDQYCPIKF